MGSASAWRRFQPVAGHHLSCRADSDKTLLAAPYLMMLSDDAGTDGSAAFADRKAQTLVHRDRRDQLQPFIDVLSPGITISVPSGRLTTPVTSVVRK